MLRAGLRVRDFFRMGTQDLSRALGRVVRSAKWNPKEIAARLAWNMRWLDSGQGWACTVEDPAYPLLLKAIADPPVVLYGRGALSALRRPCAAVVGTRQPDAAGCRAAREVAGQFAHRGYNVVSGLAFGIDICAHEAVLEMHERRGTSSSPLPAARGAQFAGSCADTKNSVEREDAQEVLGVPVAVLGTGIDAVYPREHKAQARGILECGGAIISELPPHSDGLVHRNCFIGRNRIISGLSACVVVVQCPKKSGALATADFALEQGRTVWTHSAGLRPQFEGTRELYDSGAQCIDAEEKTEEETQNETIGI